LRCRFCSVRMNIIKVGPGPRLPGVVHARNVSQFGRDFNSGAFASLVAFDPLSLTSLSLRPKSLSRFQCQPVLKYRQHLHLCFAGGQGMKENDDGVRMHLLFLLYYLLLLFLFCFFFFFFFFFFQTDAPLILIVTWNACCILLGFLML